MIDLNALKLYTKKISEKKFFETAEDSDINAIFSPAHKYTFEIYPSDNAGRNDYALLCRMNVEQNNKRLAFENIDYSKRTDSKAIINTKEGICNVSISNSQIYPSGVYDYSVAYILRGEGQCFAHVNYKYLFILDKIANLSSISFFPSWNRYGVRANEFGDRYATGVKVKVYCDDEEIFNGEMTGLVPNDRVYVTFDKFNQCHLEKINVGSAAAYANY